MDQRGTACRREVSSHLFSSMYTQTTSLCARRRPCRHYTEHRLSSNRRHTDLSSSRTVGVLRHKPATRQPLPLAESRMWQTGQHQLERSELNPLQPPAVCWLTLDRTLSYKAHIETKKKVGTKNNVGRKPKTNFLWSHSQQTAARSSALLIK